MDRRIVVAHTNIYALPFPFVSVAITRFADGEIRPFIAADIKGKDVVYVASIYPVPSDNILEWLLTIDAIKRKGALSVTAVIAYMPYIRQSKVHREGESASAEVISRILSTSGVDRIITVDLHNESARSFFTVPVTHLSFVTLLPEIIPGCSAMVVVSPDEGSSVRAKEAATLLRVPLVVLTKRRSLVAGDVVENIVLHDDVAGKTALIVDDIISTGTTLAKAAALLKANGVKKVIAVGTHAVCAGAAKTTLEKAPIDRLIVSNTIPHSVSNLPKGTEVISISSILQNAL